MGVEGTGAALERQRLLIVEDDEGIRGSLAEFLTELGFEVETACDGADGLERLSETVTPPCAILLDLLMPRMGGLEFIDRVRDGRPELLAGIVVISASPDLLQRALEQGIGAALTKPFELNALLDAVNAACARR